MNKALIKLAWLSALAVGSNNALATESEQQAQADEHVILIPIVNPITGKKEYMICPDAPDCDSDRPPPSAKLQDDND